MNNYEFGTSPRKYYPEYDEYTVKSKSSQEERRRRLENRKKRLEKERLNGQLVNKKSIVSNKNKNVKKPITKFNLKQQELKRQRQIEKRIKEKLLIRRAIVFGLAMFLAMFLVYQKSVSDQKFVELTKIKEQITEVEKENAQLQYNLQTNTSLLNIENEAVSKLGMSKLDNKRIVKLTVPKQDYVEKVEQEIVKEQKENILNTIYDWIMKIV